MNINEMIGHRDELASLNDQILKDIKKILQKYESPEKFFNTEPDSSDHKRYQALTKGWRDIQTAITFLTSEIDYRRESIRFVINPDSSKKERTKIS